MAAAQLPTGLPRQIAPCNLKGWTLGLALAIKAWSSGMAYLVESPHAQASLAGAHVRAQERRLQRGSARSKLRSRLKLAQHEGSCRAIGGVGRHVRRQVSRCLVRIQCPLQEEAGMRQRH